MDKIKLLKSVLNVPLNVAKMRRVPRLQGRLSVFEFFGEVDGGIATHRRILGLLNNFSTRGIIDSKFLKPKGSTEIRGVIVGIEGNRVVI